MQNIISIITNNGIILYYLILVAICYFLVFFNFILRIILKKEPLIGLMEFILIPFFFLIILVLLHFVEWSKKDYSFFSGAATLIPEILFSYLPVVVVSLYEIKVTILFFTKDNKDNVFVKLIDRFGERIQYILFFKIDNFKIKSNKNKYDSDKESEEIKESD